AAWATAARSTPCRAVGTAPARSDRVAAWKPPEKKGRDYTDPPPETQGRWRAARAEARITPPPQLWPIIRGSDARWPNRRSHADLTIPPTTSRENLCPRYPLQNSRTTSARNWATPSG